MAKLDGPVSRLGLAVLAAASVSACVSRAGLERAAPSPDANTVLGQAMIEAARNPGPYPKFSDIPKVPAVADQSTAWQENAARVQSDATTLAAQIAALPPATPQLTEAEAARLRSMGFIAPPSANATAETEAFARSLRNRAKPPPAPR